MDDAHLVAAIRYVELNPVRARMVASPELWPWSSVVGRMGKRDPLGSPDRPEPLAKVDDWLAFLAEGLTDEEAETIRSHARKGAALGSPAFVSRLEARTGRVLHRNPPGRPRGTGLMVAVPS